MILEKLHKFFSITKLLVHTAYEMDLNLVRYLKFKGGIEECVRTYLTIQKKNESRDGLDSSDRILS